MSLLCDLYIKDVHVRIRLVNTVNLCVSTRLYAVGAIRGTLQHTQKGVCCRRCIFSPIVSWKLCNIPLEFCSRAIHLTRPASLQSFDISPTPNYYFQCTVRPLITGIGFPVPALSPQSVTKTYSVFDSCDCFFLF